MAALPTLSHCSLRVCAALERDVFAVWLVTSRRFIEASMLGPDLLSLVSILRRLGDPEFLVWVVALRVGVLAGWRGSCLLLVLNWVIILISPIAWSSHD